MREEHRMGEGMKDKNHKVHMEENHMNMHIGMVESM
jgi:hypothetical protein